MVEINKIHLGDNLELLKQLEDNSIHSCVSDFPYNLGFMGKKWDTITNYQDWCYQRALQLFRVMRPGGICLIFGGTRTHHRLVCGFEDAGFVIKDEIQWIYGSGFPKNYNISKGFSKKDNIILSEQWDGWGTALKPAQEPIMVCQKPIEKNYCYNIEKFGVGGINVNACRVAYEEGGSLATNPSLRTHINGGNGGNIIAHEENRRVVIPNLEGRFPANIILNEESKILLDGQSNESSRFFYCAKASAKERNENGQIENKHPTVKPISLIKYLVKLVTPPQGICIDICEGSGTHARAIQELNKEGFVFNYLGFENDEESLNIANERIAVDN